MKKRTIAMFLSVALCLSVALTGCGEDKPPVSYTHLTLPTSDLV